MNKNLFLLLILVICLIVASCGKLNNENQEEMTAPQEEIPVEEIPVVEEAMAPGEEIWDPNTEASGQKREDFVVQIEVDKDTIKVGEAGELSVWIGIEDYRPTVSSGGASDREILPAEAGDYAKIIPKAPGFDLDKPEYRCMRIFAQGSSVVFNITPKEEGVYSISVIVEVYTDKDCLGTPIPRSSRGLDVVVVVDKEKDFRRRIEGLRDIFWDKFNWFFGALLLIVFGFIIFLIRTFLKKKTGFEDKP